MQNQGAQGEMAILEIWQIQMRKMNKMPVKYVKKDRKTSINMEKPKNV